jgi:hypothetical protein
MMYMSASAVAVAVLAFATIAGAQTVPVEKGTEQRTIKAEVLMKDKGFQITQGESAKGFLLMAGTRADIRLRNEDSVAHEFVSTMLYNLPFQLLGNGTFVRASNAAGIRVDPGQTVVLSFEVPQGTKDFENIYEVFWCNVHGKQHGDKMRGEILIVDQRGETAGG